ncbi:condensation domain-containing protein, partial [Oceanobacillus picturae]|uniref:condensation domain-containing protein n=1 Tax=Oceanobacillus picturae TaxID=171693 RepID=UPI000FF407D0
MKDLKKYDDPIKYWKEEIAKAKAIEKIEWGSYSTESNEKGQYLISIDKYYCNKLKELCKNNNLMMYTFLVSVLNVTISKYLSNKDITIGVPCYRAANQKRVMLNKVLPLTSNINIEESFVDYMLNTKNSILRLYKNQSYLNSKLLQNENISSDLMELTPINVCMRGLHDEIDIEYILSSSKNELSFIIEEFKEDSTNIKVVFNQNNFSEDNIKILCNSFFNVLNSVLINHNQKISEIDIISEEEKNKILYEFNDTEVKYPKVISLQELFEAQVEKTPDQIAVVFEDKQLTYRE